MNQNAVVKFDRVGVRKSWKMRGLLLMHALYLLAAAAAAAAMMTLLLLAYYCCCYLSAAAIAPGRQHISTANQHLVLFCCSSFNHSALPPFLNAHPRRNHEQ